MNKSLKGLILAGGKSTRMGTSKARINWHGKEQQYYLADLLGLFCEEVFISCREDQQSEIDKKYQTVIDQYPGAGPFEALLSAFQKHTDCGWMIMACDIPLIDESTLKYLMKQRDSSKIATVFENPEDGLPEPLIGIWETESFEVFKQHHQKEQISLRKILIRHGAKIIKAPYSGALINVNTPADAERVAETLKKDASFNRQISG